MGEFRSEYQNVPQVRYVTHICLFDAEPYPITTSVVQRVTWDNSDLIITLHRPDCKKIRKS